MTFDEYVGSRLSSLLHLAGVLSGDSHLAEDVVQEVLMKAAKQWPRVQASASPDAYIRRMVIHEYVSWRRNWARIVPSAQVDAGLRVADHAERHSERDDLDRRMQRLPAAQRAVLVLRYYEGLSDDAIARILRCSRGTVRSRAARALFALRVELTHPTLEPTREDA